MSKSLVQPSPLTQFEMKSLKRVCVEQIILTCFSQLGSHAIDIFIVFMFLKITILILLYFSIQKYKLSVLKKFTSLTEVLSQQSETSVKSKPVR